MERTCGHCSGPLPPAAGVGRRRVYCSANCRQRAYERRCGYGADSTNGARGWVEALVDRDGDCRLCGEPLDKTIKSGPMAPVTDHMIPTVWGGATHPDNLHAVHLICNAKKGTRFMLTADEFRRTKRRLELVQDALPFEESA